MIIPPPYLVNFSYFIVARLDQIEAFKVRTVIQDTDLDLRVPHIHPIQFRNE